MTGRTPLHLASTSPRRHELLRAAGIPFVVVEPGPEPRGSGAPRELCALRAREKALHARGAQVPGLVLGVDTVVECAGQELDKPTSRAHARTTLLALAGREHLVHSAHCLVDNARGVLHERLVSATVRCAPLDEATLDAYLATSEWTDKAGGYGIQGSAGAFMTLTSGALDTVIGISIATVRELLAAASR